MGIFEPINSPEYSAFKSMITPFSLKPNLPKWKSSLTPKMMEQLGVGMPNTKPSSTKVTTPDIDAELYKQFPRDAQTLPSLDDVIQPISPNQEATSNSPSAYESGILEQSKRQNDLLLQAANNAYANQERNAQNQVINYNNNQQAQMNRTANSMQSGSFTPTYQQAVYTPQSMNFGTQQAVQENPYAQFFNKNSMQITPSKDGLKPKDIPMDAITQNGQSIWNTDGTMRKNTSIKQDTKDFFNKNAGGYLPRAYETSQDRINKMRTFGKQQYQGSYNPNMGGY